MVEDNGQGQAVTGRGENKRKKRIGCYNVQTFVKSHYYGPWFSIQSLGRMRTSGFGLSGASQTLCTALQFFSILTGTPDTGYWD